jgi:hypothetical protein
LIRSLRSLIGAPSFAGAGLGPAGTVTLIRSLRSLIAIDSTTRNPPQPWNRDSRAGVWC